MGNQFIQRVLTRQFLGANALGDLLSSVQDATPTNNPGSKIFVQDISGNMASFVYAYTTALTAGFTTGVPMYWSSVARTTLTDTIASAVTYAATSDSAIQSAGGISINSTVSTAYPYAWFCCGGYMSGLPTPSSASVGDLLILSNAATTVPTADTWVRVAKGTAPATPEGISTLYVCVTSVTSTGVAAGLVMGTAGLP